MALNPALGTWLLVILITCFLTAARLASAGECAGILSFHQVAASVQEGTRVVQVPSLREYRIYESPLFTLSREMVRSADIRRYDVQMSPRDRVTHGLHETKQFVVTFRLTDKATEIASSSFDQRSRAILIAICDGEVLGATGAPDPFAGELELPPFDKLAGAQQIAQAFAGTVRSPTDLSSITSRGVGELFLGDRLAQTVRKLEGCELQLELVQTAASESPAITADCGVDVRMVVVLSADGRVSRIAVVGGEARTSDGIGIGTPVNEIIGRLGQPKVDTSGGGVCLSFDSAAGLQFCLDEQGAEQYRQQLGLTSSEPPLQGTIATVMVAGDREFDP
jgi:hypothetical protein